MTRRRAEEYRQRAQECLDMARSLGSSANREILIDMAQTWLERAEQQEEMTSLGSTEHSQQTTVQQQQQIQPERDEQGE